MDWTSVSKAGLLIPPGNHYQMRRKWRSFDKMELEICCYQMEHLNWLNQSSLKRMIKSCLVKTLTNWRSTWMMSMPSGGRICSMTQSWPFMCKLYHGIWTFWTNRYNLLLPVYIIWIICYSTAPRGGAKVERVPKPKIKQAHHHAERVRVPRRRGWW